jgi:hypothetical protein
VLKTAPLLEHEKLEAFDAVRFSLFTLLVLFVFFNISACPCSSSSTSSTGLQL